MAILSDVTCTVKVGSTALDVAEDAVTLTFDEGNSPWMTATAVVVRPADATLALLEPVAKSTIVLTFNVAGVPLALSFQVIDWGFSPDEDRVALALASSEYTLQTYAPPSNINYNTTDQGSLRGLCQKVLTKAMGKTTTVTVGSGADVALPTTRDVTNYIPGGSFETSTGLWTGIGATVTLVTGWKQFGSYSLKITPNSSSTQSWASVVVPVAAGGTYTLSAYVRVQAVQTGTPQSSARTFQAVATFQDGTAVSNVIIGRSDQAPNTGFTTTRVSMTFTVPQNATSVAVRLVNGASNFADNSIYVDGVLLVEGNGKDTNGTVMDYFDGDVTDTALYRYDWTGDAGLSTATRTALGADEDSLLWTAGTTADEFLRPVVEAAGFRLFQNETGAWLLANADYAVPGDVALRAGSNLYEGSETTSVQAEDVDGFPLNADSVIVKYSWTDYLGNERSAVDVAAPTGSTRPYVLEKDGTPFPGKGQAAYLLKRLQARTRLIETTGRPDWSARPGMGATVVLPNRPLATGYVEALTFDYATRTMALSTKGLVTTPSSAWSQLAAGVAWSASPVGGSWAAETV
ncbi:hypothetical protein I8920_09515 [Curtobacterium sp. YC1]|uniref:carbohydrate binding domain-containing protein n=1 Tax=Curtobacterium sp. YC1 TaxID=2795488 RepID=UPI0018E56F22|nr:carbohydrate binding domain-containing protein [Curtobacterium sp. YC1]QQD75106.1 hypothetical protein I8920_09515 [Curtobacterium sp. YC1]